MRGRKSIREPKILRYLPSAQRKKKKNLIYPRTASIVRMARGKELTEHPLQGRKTHQSTSLLEIWLQQQAQGHASPAPTIPSEVNNN